MSTTAGTLARSRDTLLARIVSGARAHAPSIGRWLARAGRRTRTLTLQVSGLGMVVAAAWMVAVPLGLLVGGVSLLVLEHLSAPEGRA